LKIGTVVLAETGGSSPESGATSRLKTLSNSLTSLGYGSTSSGGWGDWGLMWNRIYSAGTFSPDGDLTVGEVSPGKTFYAGINNRTQKVGTGTIYSAQSLATKDDYTGDAGYTSEEAIWTNLADGTVGATGLASGEIKLDTRTGLVWSASSTATYANQMDAVTNGVRPTGGNSIAFCNGLNSVTYGGKTNWYLPTQKELFQAYIDGIYGQDNVFGTNEQYWSSSEVSDSSTLAWYVGLQSGYTVYGNKSNAFDVRCVSRDL